MKNLYSIAKEGKSMAKAAPRLDLNYDDLDQLRSAYNADKKEVGEATAFYNVIASAYYAGLATGYNAK